MDFQLTHQQKLVCLAVRKFVEDGATESSSEREVYEL
jgi:hypothetical protein